MLVGGVELTFLDGEDGIHIAAGIAYGLAMWLGYPLGLHLVVLLLWPVVRLVDTTHQRIDWLTYEFQIPLPEHDDDKKPSVVVRLIDLALFLYTIATVIAVIGALYVGLRLLAGIDLEWHLTAVIGGLGMMSYAYVFLIALWLRGHVEIIAYTLQRTRQPRDVVMKVNRWLRLV